VAKTTQRRTKRAGTTRAQITTVNTTSDAPAVPTSKIQHRREETKRRAQQRQRQRLLTRIGAVVLAGVLVAAVAWWYSSQSESSSGQALYQFTTNDFHSLAFDPTDADRIFFGHHGGLMVSDDGGESWDDTALTGADAMQLAVPPADASRMYVAGHDVFYVSTDGGETWSSQPNNLPSLDLHAFAGSPLDPLRLYTAPAGEGIYTSADGGSTWEPIAMPPGADRAPVALAVAPDDPLHVYAGAGSTIAESADGGRTWQELPGEGLAGTTVIALAIDPDIPTTLFAGTDQGLFTRTADGAWQELAVDTSGAVLAVAISPNQPERVAIVDQNGNFYRSDDAGESWTDK
jgi:photosystem II stability/assembly factor-like uncharacterized protein